MRSLGAELVVALSALSACTPELIAPTDAEWPDACVFMLSQEQPFTITSEELSRCESVKFVVVNFCGALAPDDQEIPLTVLEW